MFMPSEWKNGMLECWNAGILGVKAETKHFNCKKHLSFNFVQDKLTHHFYPVKLFFYFTGAIIPIGAKPLSSLSNSTCKFRSAVISVSNKGGQ